jgi:polygalacturonase
MNGKVIIVLSIILLNVLLLYSSEEQYFFNVKEFGAFGDGKKLDTKAIQAAIDQCAKKGGTIYFPAGKYLTGTLIMKSNVTLHLENGSTILGSTNFEDYPDNQHKYQFFRGSFVKKSLIFGYQLENVFIKGNGVIDGQGGAFVEKEMGNTLYKKRPYLLWFVQCKNVGVEDIQLQNSAFWMQHYLACDFVNIKGVKVYNHCNKNNDMIDIDGCHNVTISDCYGDTDDDGITFKTLSGRMNKNITVNNCIISSHCNAIKCGTESHAGFKNIVISNCIIKPSENKTKIYGYHEGISGISLEIVDGGIMDGIQVSNVRIDGPKVPIFIRLGNRGRTWYTEQMKPAPGQLKNVRIQHILATSTGQYGCSITGIKDHPVENVFLDNIDIQFPGGVKEIIDLDSIPEKENSYPEATMFQNLAAYGFFIRHANNIHLSNIHLDQVDSDVRPAFVCDDVTNFSLKSFKVALGENAAYMIDFRNTSFTTISEHLGFIQNEKLIRMTGINSENRFSTGAF